MAATAETAASSEARVPKSRKTLLGHVPTTSPLYQFHPVTRFVLFLFLGILPLFIFVPEVNFLLLLVSVALLRWGRVDLSGLRRYLPVIVTVAIFMFTVVLLAPGDDPSFTPVEIGGFTIYFEAVYFTFGAYWRLIAMLFGTILYFSTNRERDMLVAMRSLRLPFVASYVVGLSIRSAGLFMEDFRTIREAEQARGLDTKTMRFSDLVKLYMMYLVPLFSIALRRADEISNALFARGYTLTGRVRTGGKRYDYIRSLYELRRRDWVAMVTMAVIFILVAIAQLFFGVFALENSPLYGYLSNLLNVAS
jgi:energy-coupling factor transporter transmembrane protein EcfT